MEVTCVSLGTCRAASLGTGLLFGAKIHNFPNCVGQPSPTLHAHSFCLDTGTNRGRKVNLGFCC